MKNINISGVDRISELSDEVLGQILSFLPSMEAIATCLLSKRWRYVWKLVSALDFVCLPDMTIKAHTKVSEFLRLCGTKRITRFHIKCKSHSLDLDLEGNTGPCCLYHIQEFVDAAIAVKVEQQSISMSCQSHDEPILVPTYLFNCATIVTLKLEGPFILLVPSYIQLPSLKSLHLNVRKCEPSLEKFLSGIPSLEVFYLKKADNASSLDFSQLPQLVHQLELHLRKDGVSLPIRPLTTTIVTMKIEGLFILHVPSRIQLPSLKSLHLNVRKCEPSCKKFLSGSPALQVFYLNEIDNLWLKEFKVERNSQGNLIVSNNLQNHHEYDYVYMTLHKVDDHSHVLSMLNAMQNVEYLCDWKEMMEVNHHSFIDSPQFPNLVHLELRLRNNVVSLPINLFTCTTIVTLKIEGSFTLHVPSRIQLPSLKSLHLNVRRCEPSCKKFLSGSPALQAFYVNEIDNLWLKEFKVERNSQGKLIVSKNFQNRLEYDYVYMTLHKVDDHSHVLSMLNAMQNVEFLYDWKEMMEVNHHSSIDSPQFPNLVHLELRLRNNVVSLPINLFTCTTIVTLKIEGSFTLSVPSCIQLPSLKRLHLNLRNCEPASCKAILSGSPALEFFHLKHEWRDGFEDLIIERNSGANLIVSKNQLINLVIQSDGGYDCFQDYFEGHLENIVKAKVFMTLNPNWSSNIHEVYAHAFSILKAMRNVEFLSLCDISLEGYSSVDLPKLPNLVQLQLHILHYSSQILKLVSSEYCPKLEEFGVNNMHWKYCEQQKKWINMTTRGMHPDHFGPLS